MPGEAPSLVGLFRPHWLHEADSGSRVVPEQPMGSDLAMVVDHEQIEIWPV